MSSPPLQTVVADTTALVGLAVPRADANHSKPIPPPNWLKGRTAVGSRLDDGETVDIVLANALEGRGESPDVA